jgi:hypothetical protein
MRKERKENEPRRKERYCRKAEEDREGVKERGRKSRNQSG